MDKTLIQSETADLFQDRWSALIGAEFSSLVLDFEKLASPGSTTWAVPKQRARDIKTANRAMQKFLRGVFGSNFNNEILACSINKDTPYILCPLTKITTTRVQTILFEKYTYTLFFAPGTLWILVQHFSRVISAIHPATQSIYISGRVDFSEKTANDFLSSLIYSINSYSKDEFYQVNSLLCASVRPSHYFYDSLPSLADLLGQIDVDRGDIVVRSISGRDFIDPSLVFPRVRYEGIASSPSELNKVLARQLSAISPPGGKKYVNGVALRKLDVEIAESALRWMEGQEALEAFVQADGVKIWLGLCTEKRGWPEQYASLRVVLADLAKKGPVMVVVDGLTRTWSQDRDQFRVESCTNDLAALDDLRSLFPEGLYVDMIGANSFEKIAYALHCDLFISSAVTDSMWPSRFACLPGIAHTNTLVNLASYIHPRTRRVPDDVITDLVDAPGQRADRVSYSIPVEAFRAFFSDQILVPFSEVIGFPVAVDEKGASGFLVRNAARRALLEAGDATAWEVQIRQGTQLRMPPRAFIQIEGGFEYGVEIRAETEGMSSMEVGFAWHDDQGFLAVDWVPLHAESRCLSPPQATRLVLHLRGVGPGTVVLYECKVIRPAGSEE